MIRGYSFLFSSFLALHDLLMLLRGELLQPASQRIHPILPEYLHESVYLPLLLQPQRLRPYQLRFRLKSILLVRLLQPFPSHELIYRHFVFLFGPLAFLVNILFFLARKHTNLLFITVHGALPEKFGEEAVGCGRINIF